jgi:hypothetical protein
MAITESKQGKLAIDRSTAYAAARGSIVLSLNLIISEDRARGSYFPLVLHLSAADVSVTAYSERGRLDLNYGNLNHIKRVLLSVDTDERMTSDIMLLLKARRENMSPFTSITEFQLEAGLDGVTFKKISPYITVWAGPGAFDIGAASSSLVSMLNLRPVRSFPKLDSTYTLEAKVSLKNGFSYQLAQTFRFRDGKSSNSASLLRSEETWSSRAP